MKDHFVLRVSRCSDSRIPFPVFPRLPDRSNVYRFKLARRKAMSAIRAKLDIASGMIEARLCQPPARMVLGRLRHAPIEIREIPVELLEREGEGENAFGLVDRKGACQPFTAH